MEHDYTFDFKNRVQRYTHRTVDYLKSKGAIIGFTGEYEFLSNSFHCPIQIGEQWFSSNEHAIAYTKMGTVNARVVHVDGSITIKLKDGFRHMTFAAFNRMLPADVARMASDLVPKTDEHGQVWKSKKREVVEKVLRRKFIYPELARKLGMTGNVPLVNANTYGDTTYGCVLTDDIYFGRDRLGKGLMRIRTRIIENPFRGERV